MSLVGKTTQKQEVDPTLAAESHSLIGLFRMLMGQDPQINRGVTIAATTPKQEAAFNMGDAAASAFGFAPAGSPSMPERETSASGIEGYSIGKDYDKSISMLPEAFKEFMGKFRERASTETPIQKYAGGGGKK